MGYTEFYNFLIPLYGLSLVHDVHVFTMFMMFCVQKSDDLQINR
jgi:hypothetical protein